MTGGEREGRLTICISWHLEADHRGEQGITTVFKQEPDHRAIVDLGGELERGRQYLIWTVAAVAIVVVFVVVFVAVTVVMISPE